MLLYSSSSISFTLRQYDWKGKKQAEFVLCFKQHKYIYFKQVRREQRVSAAKTGKKQSAVNSPGIQTSRPGTSGWWASCPEWPCEGKCSDRAASERSAETCSQWPETCRSQQALVRRTEPAEGATCTHRFDGLQQLDAVFLNAAVRVGKLHKGLAGCGLRFSYADDGENIPECWEDRFKQKKKEKKSCSCWIMSFCLAQPWRRSSRKRRGNIADPSELLHVYYTNMDKFQKIWDNRLTVWCAPNTWSEPHLWGSGVESSSSHGKLTSVCLRELKESSEQPLRVLHQPCKQTLERRSAWTKIQTWRSPCQIRRFSKVCCSFTFVELCCFLQFFQPFHKSVCEEMHSWRRLSNSENPHTGNTQRQLTIAQNGSAEAQSVCRAGAQVLYQTVLHLFQDWNKQQNVPSNPSKLE